MQSLPKRKLAYIAADNFCTAEEFIEKFQGPRDIICFSDCTAFLNDYNKEPEINGLIVSGNPTNDKTLTELRKIQSVPKFKAMPLILISNVINTSVRKAAFSNGISEIFTPNFDMDAFQLRLDYLISQSSQTNKKNRDSITKVKQYKIGTPKRVFDIIFSTLVLLMLLPVFIIIGVMIKLESRGPIFYSSKRVGTGYRIFDFYKFRSMSEGADKKIKDLSNLNQYKKENGPMETSAGLCSECTEKEIACQSMLYKDGETICEKMHKRIQKDLNGATFVKFKGDPRVTKVGQFIRNTSIDELPQLFNVLIGDMSIVGNRPLPLYEAEKITTDRFISRFMAPAGITGLWQVSKRGGKGKMSEDERIALDIVYAAKHSFWGDIKIILKTIPALLQKENV